MDRANEADLVHRAKNGDHRAFELLVKDVRPIVFRRSLASTKDAAQADDIAQETMIRAYTKLHTFRGDSKFSTWVYTICNRCILMYFRSKSRKPTGRIGDISHPEVESAIRRFRAPEYTQEEIFEYQQKVDSIDAAMQQLPPMYYQVIDLWLSGNSLPQIGQITNLTVPAAKTRIHRARNKIRGMLQAA